MSQASPHPQTPRSDRAERTRQRILDAAGQRIAAQGYAKATVEEIAASAGVSKGIVYHHFRGKEGILEALLERTLSDWEAVTSLDRELAAGRGVMDAIGESLRASLEYARDNPLIRALFQLDPDVLPVIGTSAAVRRRVEEARVSMVAAIERGIRSGELRAELDAPHTADVVRLVTMALMDHLLNPEWIDVDDELVKRSLEVLFHGIAGAER